MGNKEQNNKEICQRFSDIRYHLFGGKNKDFANALEYSEDNLSAICKGHRTPPKKLIEKILKEIPEISAEWLLYGIGEMKKQTQNNNLTNDIIRQYEDEIKQLEGQIKALERQLDKKDEIIFSLRKELEKKTADPAFLLMPTE